MQSHDEPFFDVETDLEEDYLSARCSQDPEGLKHAYQSFCITIVYIYDV